MIYLDTNLFVYALSQNVDDISQKEIALRYLREAIEKDGLITSEIVLYEFAFVSKKLGEESKNIGENLEFLADFVKRTPNNLFVKAINFMNKHHLHKHSFDVYHLCYAEELKCKKLFTFDKGFQKLQKYTDVKIEIL